MNLQTIINNGGATLNHTLNEVNLKSGYMVSLPSYEQKMNLNDVHNFESILTTYKRLAKEKGAYVGLWIDGGTLYFDLSIRVQGKQVATLLGKNWNQLAIFNNKTRNVVSL